MVKCPSLRLWKERADYHNEMKCICKLLILKVKIKKSEGGGLEVAEHVDIKVFVELFTQQNMNF